MGKLTERLDTLRAQMDDLAPLAEPVRNCLVEGNRAILLGGDTPEGRPVKPLAASTLKARRKQGLTGPPRCPHGAASRLVGGYVVDVSTAPGELAAAGSWPSFPEASYVDAVRPFTGFRRVDLESTMNQLRQHIIK